MDYCVFFFMFGLVMDNGFVLWGCQVVLQWVRLHVLRFCSLQWFCLSLFDSGKRSCCDSSLKHLRGLANIGESMWFKFAALSKEAIAGSSVSRQALSGGSVSGQTAAVHQWHPLLLLAGTFTF